MQLFFSKLALVSAISSLLIFLSTCGQKGPLYIQENSEMPSVDFVFDKETENNTSSTHKTSSDNTTNNTNTKP